MEQLKVNIDQMIEQLKQRSVGQSTVDSFELMGKLEQSELYMLAEGLNNLMPTAHIHSVRPQQPYAYCLLPILILQGLNSPYGCFIYGVSTARSFQHQQQLLLMAQQPAPSSLTLQQQVLLLAASSMGLNNNPPWCFHNSLGLLLHLWGLNSLPLHLWGLNNNFFLCLLHGLNNNPPWFHNSLGHHHHSPLIPDDGHYWFNTVVDNLEAIIVPERYRTNLRNNSPTYSFINSQYFDDIGIPVTITSRSYQAGPSNRARPLNQAGPSNRRKTRQTLQASLRQILADRSPELLEFSKDLSSLEPATKIQLKFLAKEMQYISKGTEKVVHSYPGRKMTGPMSENFCKYPSLMRTIAPHEMPAWDNNIPAGHNES
ncbi:hypothetical protein CQW23_27025 [Capsicum baccatum]|uniref:Uncharacterized protein n=1 Tax=Capsicum baccatum TaxID=33114 RepID=A0A2G2VQG7_CAPBA|nr:hypothetical protein CQW23_27025 [Capsicum baccatum]